MSVSPVQKSPNPSASTQSGSKPRVSQGIAETPDRIEKAKDAPQDNPPSLFKMFLFDPIIQIFKFILRGIFNFFDYLRNSAFEEKKPLEAALTRETFLNRLQAAPRGEKLLLQFSQVYSTKEQDQVYRTIGEAHKGKISWKENLWNRTPVENMALGRSLVKENPLLLRDFLFL